MADVEHTHRLTGPYGRMVQDAETRSRDSWSIRMRMITPT